MTIPHPLTELSRTLHHPQGLAHLSALFFHSPHGVSLQTADGRVVRTNPAFERMVGYLEPELTGLTVEQLLHPDDRAEQRRFFDELTDDKRDMFTVTRRFLRLNGQMLWVNSTCAALRDVEGRFQYAISFDEDITERRKGEEALQAIAEATFSASGTDFFRDLVRLLATALNVPYALVTECTNPLKDHVRALAFWREEKHIDGYEYDLAGTPCQRVVQQNTLSYHPRDVQRLFPKDQDLVGLQAQSYLGIPIYDSVGNVLGHLFVMDRKAMENEPRGLSILKIFAARAGAELERKQHDAERERLIEQLRLAKDRAQESSRLKSEFLATMSHELRTPLNAVIGFAGILRDGMAGEIDAVAHELVGSIFDSSQHLLGLITDILDLSKIEAGRMELLALDVPLADLVGQWRAQLEVLAQTKGLATKVTLDPKLPPLIRTDRDRLTQVIANLIANAVKFTEHGSVTLALKLAAGDLVIAVTDTGVGIAPHAFDYIFDEFRQVNGSYNRSKGGAGLGLAIVRKLCRLMGGSIRVESEQGKGSTFIVTLPLGQSTNVADSSSSQEEAAR